MSSVAPALAVDIPWRVASAVACAVIGVVIVLTGIVAFRKAHTTMNPLTPDASSALVGSGLYRRSRNPMYVGLWLLLAGWALYLSNVAAMVFLPVFVWYMNRFQITPEERALEAKFGPSYRSYRQRVRRWI